MVYSSSKGDPTIEDSYTKRTVIDKQQCILEVLDTSGNEAYAALRHGWISGGEAFMLVYSIHDHSTLAAVRKNGLLICGKPAMIVGSNYTDKAEAVPRKRIVSIEEGFALAKELGCGFIEVSAKDQEVVEKAFHDLVREVRERAARKGEI
jgi:GTPase KRas protein